MKTGKHVPRFRRALAAAAASAFAAGNLFGEVKIHPDAGTTSAAFLKIGPGARASALAGAFTAVSDDAASVYWNPAALAITARPCVTAAHNESFEGIRHDYIGYAGGKYGDYRWGAAFTALYTPSDIERRGGFNEADPFEPITAVEGYFAAYDAALSIAAARRVGGKVYAGAALKIINQTIDDVSGRGLALDAGVRYDYSERWAFGAVVRNVGTPLAVGSRAYPMPLSLRAGAAYTSAESRAGKIRLSGEMSVPTDNYPSFHFGAEYMPVGVFSLRAGYRYRLYGLELGDLSGLALGAGVKVSALPGDFTLDYSFNPYGVLGDSHRITLSAAFGREPQPLASRAAREASVARPADSAPRLRVALPSPPSPDQSSPLTPPQGAGFSEVRAVFTPLIVSPSGSSGSLEAGELPGGIKSLRAKLNARGEPQALLRGAFVESADGKSADYYLRSGIPGRITDVILVVESPRGLKSARHADKGVEIKVEEIKSETALSYEIKMPVFGDFRVFYE